MSVRIEKRDILVLNSYQIMNTFQGNFVDYILHASKFTEKIKAIFGRLYKSRTGLISGTLTINW